MRAAAILALTTAAVVLALGWVGAPIWAVAPAGGAAAAALSWALHPRPSVPKPPPAEPDPEPGLSGLARALLEESPTPLLLVDERGRVTYANAAAQALLPRFARGIHFTTLFRAPVFLRAVNEVFVDGETRAVRFTIPAQNRHYEARVALLPDARELGPRPVAMLQVEDRTKDRRTEQMRTDFIANASHELKTPLASVLGYIETLQGHAREDAEVHDEFLKIMHREALRMQRLVEDLMSLSRIEMGPVTPPTTVIDLRGAALEAMEALAAVARSRGVTLAADLPDCGAHVRGDRDQLTQILGNLIDNAVKYSGEGATVTLGWADDPQRGRGRVGLTVADTGAGIAREHLHRLTERFFRVPAGSAAVPAGTGLGLAIVKHILNRHRGELDIASELGKGSRFTVWLPRAAAPSPADA